MPKTPADCADPGPSVERPAWIKIWFVVDAVVALAPPFYWAADGDIRPVFGIPRALAYFLAVGLCISASIVAACLHDIRQGGAR